jgi:glycosidase
MGYYRQLLLFVFIFTFLLSCKKEEDVPIVAPPVVTDSSYKQYGTPFDNIPLTRDIIMYEVNLRAFSTSGDIQGVINRLDQIKALGVNVIWIMPIHPIGEINAVNSPYSVKDFKAVSSEYGSLDDLRNLTDEAHAKNMAVIMDWVANHTAWDNEWINNESWYTQDGNGNIVHPPGTNWLDVADLNFANDTMRAAMIDAMKYWALEANVDGFRCDYADGVPFDFWEQAIDTIESIPNRDFVFLAEGNRSDHFDAGFDLNFSWDSYGKTKAVFDGQAASGLFSTHTSEYNSIPEGKHKLRFTTNHDESAWDSTPMVLFNGKEGAMAASVTSIFIGGVPLIYTGQEVGRLENVPFFSNAPINWDDNPDMLISYQEILNFYSQSELAKKGSNYYFPQTDVVCFKKILNSDELLMIVNVRNNPVNFSIPSSLIGTNWTNALTNATINFQTSLQLENYEYLIFKN